MSLAEDERTRRLLELGSELVAELDSESVLERILEEARALTGARYAALGVLDENRRGLSRFVTFGIAEAARGEIGELPHGRGVLGVLIEDPRPLRLTDVGSHPRSYGFPAGHPEMRSFLGVPITIRGEAWGNLYLTEKESGEPFDEDDEVAVVALARWAAVAIENARLYESSERGRAEAERAVRSLEAARDITELIGSAEELERVLELIVKRGRALVGARTVLIMLLEADQLVVRASAGESSPNIGRALPVAHSASGQMLASRKPRRIVDVTRELVVSAEDLGVPDAHTALLVPMLNRDVGLGVLAAFDRGAEGRPFSAQDEQLLATFAQAAANGVAIRRSVEAERLRSAIEAADAERSRWARELHDQTLQSLGGLRVLLASARRRTDPSAHQAAIEQAISDIELEIENLRGIITDLRPSLLDDLGLRPALEALVERRREAGIQISAALELAGGDERTQSLVPELETTTYRIVQESLTNVVKHARAQHVRVSVRQGPERILIEIQDDGSGFEPAARTSGFGLTGMRERVYLAGGSLEVKSGDRGTTVRAELPVLHAVSDHGTADAVTQ